MLKLAEKGKLLRLEALKNNPEAFGSTYEREITLGDEHWRNRLAFPNSRSFVAVDLHNTENLQPNTAAATDLEVLSSAPWVGTMALNGPRLFQGIFPKASDSAYDLLSSSANGVDPNDLGDVEEPKTILYGVYATYVKPGFRGKKIGKRLMEAVIRACERDYAEQRRMFTNSRGVCLVFLAKGNELAKPLYEGAGFEFMGEGVHTAPHGWTGVTIGYRKEIGDD
jgi:GNAT superfamily N-acetyltransferase